MNINKQNSCDWVLNPSKRFPGKYYYFNVVTGETVWSLNGAESKLLKKCNSAEQVGDKMHYCPEPVTPPNENPITPSVFYPRNSCRNVSQPQTFGHAIFPNYINNAEPNFPNIIWAPIPVYFSNMSEARRPMLDQNTQTSEPARDLFVQTCTIPLSQRFASFGNIDAHSPTNAHTYKNNYYIPVKNFHISTPMKNWWNNTEKNNLYTGKCKKGDDISSQLQYKRKLDEPKLILKDEKIKKFSETDSSYKIDSLISKTNVNKENVENESLCQSNKVENTKNDKNNEDSSKKLDKCDLRFLLQSKRCKSANLGRSNHEKQGEVTNKIKTAPKKNVSFNLSNISDDYASVQDNGERDMFKEPLPIKLLKSLNKLHINNEWYISTDEDVLLEDFDFIIDYIATVQVVETADGTSLMEDVIKSCIATMDMDIHVVLITKYPIFEKIAKSYGIHVYSLDYIKNGGTRSKDIVSDGENTKDNLFLQSAENFDPFILSKHADKPIKRTLFNNSDSNIFDTNKEYKLNHLNKENPDNSLDICQNIEKLNINNEKYTNIKRVINNSYDKSKISERNINNSNKTKPIKSIFDHIDTKNDKFNKNNCIVKLTKTVSNNFFEPVNSKKNVFIDNKEEDLRDDRPSYYNERYTEEENTREFINRDMNMRRFDCLDTLDDKLKGFHVEDETIENNIISRSEELICCYVQIMEELVNFVLRKNIETKDQIPFFLREGLVNLKEIYYNRKEIKTVIEKLLALCGFCPMKGNLKKDIKANDFLKILGCGFLLVDSLEDVLSEDLTEIKVLLITLLENIESSHSFEDPEQVETPLKRSEPDIDTCLFRHNFIKRRSDIIDYLKRHYVEWKNYDDNENEAAENEDLNPNVKIFRTSGRNLNTFKIDNKKRISIENPKEQNLKDKNKNTKTNNHTEINIPTHGNTFNDGNDKDGPKVIRNVRLIDEYEERIKSHLDLDVLDYSEIADTLSVESKKFNKTQINDYVGLTRSNDSLFLINDNYNDVRDSTADSGFGNEIHACTLIRNFLTELSVSFKLIYTFIDKCIKEFRDEEMTDETKKNLVDKANQTHTHIADVIEKLKAIIERESSDSTLKSLLVKAGSDIAEDKRMTRYRQTVTKCLEQAQILESSLKIMISVTNDDCDISVSSKNEINHFNIFE
ncbi:unnamed protein product [Euphydryas editha]|uniref:WW domain-containing protein n=1 Tax=Euphydryas editha TaxID=104508 RepID=A0AAU9UR68_EUPED|nr:unnamed protein product [Euphydryas editha]